MVNEGVAYAWAPEGNQNSDLGIESRTIVGQRLISTMHDYKKRVSNNLANCSGKYSSQDITDLVLQSLDDCCMDYKPTHTHKF